MQLQQRVSVLENQVNSINSRLGSSTGTTGNGGNTGATIAPTNASIPAGSVVDFNGRNFSHESNVRVTLNGQTVTTAHADGEGNFTTGSLRVPSTPGSYTYSFVDQDNGSTIQTTINVQ